MFLADVSVLVAAFRENHPRHEASRGWLITLLRSGEPFAVSDLVLSSVLRVVTHPTSPIGGVPLKLASEFVETVRRSPGAEAIAPGSGHWEIFMDLARRSALQGAALSDAYFAAIAVEHGCEWVTLDRDFARFPGLRWSFPS